MENKLYEELYREAWESFEQYWESAGIKSVVIIVSEELDGIIFLEVLVRISREGNINTKILSVCEYTLSKEVGISIWKYALNDLLASGATKLYQDSVLTKRNAVKNDYRNQVFLFPMTVKDCHEVSENKKS